MKSSAGTCLGVMLPEDVPLACRLIGVALAGRTVNETTVQVAGPNWALELLAGVPGIEPATPAAIRRQAGRIMGGGYWPWLGARCAHVPWLSRWLSSRPALQRWLYGEEIGTEWARVPLHPEHLEEAMRVRQRQQLSEPIVLLSPCVFAGRHGRRLTFPGWPMLTRMFEDSGVTVAVLPGGGDLHAIGELLPQARIIDVASTGISAALLQQASLTISDDPVVIHIAEAISAPVFALTRDHKATLIHPRHPHSRMLAGSPWPTAAQVFVHAQDLFQQAKNKEQQAKT